MRRERTPLDETLAELVQAERELKEWKDLTETPAYKRLVAFLEARYVWEGEKDCNSLAELKGRNACMQLIRDIFGFMCNTARERELLLHNLHMMSPNEDE